MLMSIIILTLDSTQLKEQAGIWSGYPTTDQIDAINQVVKNYVEYTKPPLHGFHMLWKAFDSVKISADMKAIRKN